MATYSAPLTRPAVQPRTGHGPAALAPAGRWRNRQRWSDESSCRPHPRGPTGGRATLTRHGASAGVARTGGLSGERRTSPRASAPAGGRSWTAATLGSAVGRPLAGRGAYASRGYRGGAPPSPRLRGHSPP